MADPLGEAERCPAGLTGAGVGKTRAAPARGEGERALTDEAVPPRELPFGRERSVGESWLGQGAISYSPLSPANTDAPQPRRECE